MKPGISRAAVAGIIGFAVGALIVTGLRAAFGFTPYWNLGLVLVLGAFTTVYAVIWGIGGFNPRMSEHPDDSKPEPTEDELAEQAGWAGMLSHLSWQITFVSVALVFVLIALAVIPGFGLNITSIPDASVKGFGTVQLEVGEQTYPINQAVLLIGFVLFTVISLALSGAALMGLFWFLSSGVEESKQIEVAPPGTPREKVNPLLRRAGDFAGQLAERVAPPEDKDTTTVVPVEERQS